MIQIRCNAYADANHIHISAESARRCWETVRAVEAEEQEAAEAAEEAFAWL